jgi:hypothetical protein
MDLFYLLYVMEKSQRIKADRTLLVILFIAAVCAAIIYTV